MANFSSNSPKSLRMDRQRIEMKREGKKSKIYKDGKRNSTDKTIEQIDQKRIKVSGELFSSFTLLLK